MMECDYSASTTRYEDGIRYRRCGRSGVLLPEVSLGLWHNFGADKEYTECRAIARHAFDRGITHFDLANNYGPPYGAAEETFGRIMSDSLGRYRDELFVATKAGYDMWPGPYGNWGSRKYLMASLAQSLQRMKLEYVDLFYSHRYDPDTPLEETLQALVDIVKQGKALYVGISRWPKEATEFAFSYLAAQNVPCLLYQGRLNMLDQAPKEEGILASTAAHGVGFISFSPLAQGLLTDRYLHGVPTGSRMTQNRFLKESMLTESLQTKLHNLHTIATERGEKLAETALAWVLQEAGITSVLVGASSTGQLYENLKCMHAAPFRDEEVRLLADVLS